jgi:hypothetical protein
MSTENSSSGNLDGFKTFLQGKKTYFVALVAGLYLLGCWAGIFEFDQKVLAGLGFTGLVTLRASLKGLLLLTLCGVVLVGSGCARFKTKQVDSSYEDKDNVPHRTITTTVTASTFFASTSELSKFKASQTDKTQSASVGSLNQVSDGTNAVALVDKITGAVVGAAIKAAAGK